MIPSLIKGDCEKEEEGLLDHRVSVHGNFVNNPSLFFDAQNC